MNLKSLVKTSVAVFFAVASSAANAKHLKVLMVGNSFSVCVLKELPQCAASCGETLDIASLYIGGCPLERHSDNIAKASDPDFKPYAFSYSYASVADKNAAPVATLGKKTNIPQALAADKWDIVTIQQASGKSVSKDTHEPHASRLIAKIRELAPQAEIVVQQTWSYTPYASRLKKMGYTPDTMFDALKAAYADLAGRYGLRTIPMGEAVQLYRGRLPVKYGKLLTPEELESLPRPQLVDFCGDVVGSSSWREGRKNEKNPGKMSLRLDPTHLNPDGHYLQACTWLAMLFGTDVTQLQYAPPAMDKNKAKLMRECASAAVAAYRK